MNAEQIPNNSNRATRKSASRHPYLLVRRRAPRPVGPTGISSAVATSLIEALIPLVNASAGNSDQYPLSVEVISHPQSTTTVPDNSNVVVPGKDKLEKTEVNSFSTPFRVGLKTSGLETIRATRTLIIADGENIDCGARNHKMKPDWKLFRQAVERRVVAADSHVYMTAAANRVESYQRKFQRAGFTPNINPVRKVETFHGSKILQNSDNEILLGLAHLVTLKDPDAVVLLSGDGDLGESIARFLGKLATPPRLYVAGIPGETSFRLRAKNNPLVAGNVWLGLDVMHSPQQSTYVGPRRP